MSTTQPDGFLAQPSSGSGSPVLVLHAWWGLNATIRDLCTRLADAGFIAFAPDLYRGKSADTIPDAEILARSLDARHDEAMADVKAAVAFLQQRSGAETVAVIGFSLGAAYALALASAQPDALRAVVLFYGNGDADLSVSKAAFLGHFAENDDYEPREYTDALEASLRQAGRPVAFHYYAGTDHWFFEPDRPQAYNQAAADLAWERTLAFLKNPPA